MRYKNILDARTLYLTSDGTDAFPRPYKIANAIANPKLAGINNLAAEKWVLIRLVYDNISLSLPLEIIFLPDRYDSIYIYIIWDWQKKKKIRKNCRKIKRYRSSGG